MKLLIFCLLLSAFTYSEALKCYACSSTENESDQSCFDNPESVANGVITCKEDQKYCTSMRIDYLDPKDKPASVSRTCTENYKPSEVSEDATFRYYYVNCKDDICNGGTGKDTSGNGGAQGDTGGVGWLLVPGTGTAANAMLISQTLFSVCIVSIIFTYYYKM